MTFTAKEQQRSAELLRDHVVGVTKGMEIEHRTGHPHLANLSEHHKARELLLTHVKSRS